MNLIIWMIIIPLITAFVLGIYYSFTHKASKIITLSGVFLYCTAVIITSITAFYEPLIYSPGDWGLLGINLMVDSFSILILLLTALLLPLTIVYSLSWVKENEAKFYILLLLLTAGITGMSVTADLFNLYVFFELTSLTSYALVAIPKTDDSIEGAFKYLILGSISGVFILLAVILTYYTTGFLSIPQVAREFSEIPFYTRQMIGVLFVFGFSLKFALFPLHTWLPDAYTGAPLPYNVLSSGLIIKISFLALIRILYLLIGAETMATNGMAGLLIYWGAATIVVGHTLAFKQENIIRMLAYSSIAQMGYIVLGFGLTTEAGIMGGSYHFLNHAIMKGALFLTAGILINKNSDNSRIGEMKGLGYQCPVTSLMFVMAALAIVGLPPFNGFMSKWLIIKAALEADYVLAAFFVPVGSLLALTYYLKVILSLYDRVPESFELSLKGNDFKGSYVRKKSMWSPKGIPLNFKIPAFLLSVLCLLLGLFPSLPLTLIAQIPRYLIDSQKYIALFTGG
ncbi:MAG: complex I subunit 5 family protein [Halanaerobiaceae bacterium]